MLRSARIVAEFANLNGADRAAVKAFKAKHPRFAPKSWWRTIIVNSDFDGPTAGYAQKLLREAWSDDFELTVYELFRLLASVHEMPLPEGEVGPKTMLLGTVLISEANESDFHIGVRYLSENRWKARICKGCKARYVANHPRQKFCFSMGADGMRCSERAVRQSHLKSWHRNKDKWNRR